MNKQNKFGCEHYPELPDEVADELCQMVGSALRALTEKADRYSEYGGYVALKKMIEFSIYVYVMNALEADKDATLETAMGELTDLAVYHVVPKLVEIVPDARMGYESDMKQFIADMTAGMTRH